jgi:Methyltransferase FkbM domain
MKASVLPTIFRPAQPTSLIRLGRAHDGGYLVDSRDVTASDSVISLGVYDDWSFEKSFVRRNDVPVLAYDGSVDGFHFAWRVYRNLLDLHPRVVLKSLKLFADYTRFFSGRRKHVKSFVGSAQLHPNVNLDHVFEDLHSMKVSRPFLKVDIEGSEYSILDQIIARAGVTTGLAIEFHDCDEHIEEIIRFIEAYPLRLVHVHANNFSQVAASGIPTALELTFSSSEQVGGKFALPHPLDLPNNRHMDEITIGFSESTK